MRLHRGFQGVPAQRSPNGGDEEEDGGKAIKAAERGRKAKPIRQPRRRNFPPFRICSPAWLTWTQDTARADREEKSVASSAGPPPGPPSPRTGAAAAARGGEAWGAAASLSIRCARSARPGRSKTSSKITSTQNAPTFSFLEPYADELLRVHAECPYLTYNIPKSKIRRANALVGLERLTALNSRGSVL